MPNFLDKMARLANGKFTFVERYLFSKIFYPMMLTTHSMWRKNKPVSSPVKLNETQELFVKWNADRLNISEDESRYRYLKSLSCIHGGHGGSRFVMFMRMSHELLNVFSSNEKAEILESYAMHGHQHFLRQLTYGTQEPDFLHIILEELKALKEVRILDFGCGLANTARLFARHFLAVGHLVRLDLADIPTIRREFLLWMGKEMGVTCNFLECTEELPIPLPEKEEYHICIATEVFEHLHEPVNYFYRIDQSLLPSAFLITAIQNHRPGYFHVSPNLEALRSAIKANNYKEIMRTRLFQKGGNKRGA
jgi:2-polyprenyl-3-methyl-5-hydroxy-6-metoxy-1,4-benzoquinol methylase